MRTSVKIAVIGASGHLGKLVAREAIERGHQVTAITRNGKPIDGLDGVPVLAADVRDAASVAAAVRGQDAVVASVTDRTGAQPDLIPRAAEALLTALPEAGVSRLVFLGGGGTLHATPGVRYLDLPRFPQEYLAEARAQGAALDTLRNADTQVSWCYLSPPPVHLDEGGKRGGYRVAAGDSALTGADGESRITVGDYAAVVVDEVETKRFSQQRITAAYA
jgi:putative NADH-flavin reductase